MQINLEKNLRSSTVISTVLDMGYCESESVSCLIVWLFVNPWTIAHQAPSSLEFSRQESWSG